MKLPSSLQSLRARLLVGILLPVGLFIIVDAVSIYRQAWSAVTIAYDRTLLASAKSIGEALDVVGEGAQFTLKASVPYAALEAFEADNRSRFAYRVSTRDGRHVDGFEDLPFWTGTLPDKGAYAALVDFYDASFRGSPVRMAVLLQPVASAAGMTMAVIQVAETMELRQTLARQVLVDTVWRQGVLAVVVAAVVFLVVQFATRPVRELVREIEQRGEHDLQPLQTSTNLRELRPLIDATNLHVRRLEQVLGAQRRFVRDASHQLRTPLAVLKTQVQAALAHGTDPRAALGEINGTVDRATRLANQMLALAKVEQVRQDSAPTPLDWAPIARDIALDLAPLVADKKLDFEIQTAPAVVVAHAWMLRELTRNLLHNALRHSPPGGRLAVTLWANEASAILRVDDSGPGVAPDMVGRLFQPFAAGGANGGTGLGLAICHEIVTHLGGRIGLTNLGQEGQVLGARAEAVLPASPA